MSGKSMLRSFLVRFGRLGLQQRIMLYVSGGLAVVLAAYGLVSLQAVRQSTDLVFQERLAVARAVGQEIDRDLVHVQGELSEANEVAGPALVAGQPDDARAAMDAVYQHWLHYDGFDNPCVISLTDPRGMALWTEPASAGCPVDLSSHLAPQTTLPAPSIADEVAAATDHGRLWLTFPISASNKLVGYFVAGIS